MVNCAIVGATGLVGSTFLKVLEERKLPIDNFTLFATSKSKGKKIHFLDKDYEVQELTENSFVDEKLDYALFSAGGETSKKYSPIAAQNGCIVIDNSSAFRMFDDIPLVVPEVNEEKIFDNKGIIANPNCSTIQEVVILKALHEKYGLKRIICSTYQSVSGAGQKGIDDLKLTSVGFLPKKFPHKIYNNCIPQIDDFLDNDYTKEEIKIIEETRKILDLPNLNITSTAVRVPVENCHGESLNIELENEFDIDELKQIINNTKNVVVLDSPINNIYPINTFVESKDEIFVGRIRRDFSVRNGINIWIVADNIRKGAATNAVQILEKLIEKRLG